jgi:hypothetical protein
MPENAIEAGCTSGGSARHTLSDCFGCKLFKTKKRHLASPSHKTTPSANIFRRDTIHSSFIVHLQFADIVAPFPN